MPVGATVAGAAATVGGAAMSASASRNAAQTQADAADRASQVQWDMYQQQREDMAPWRDIGGSAINRLAHLAGLDSGPALTEAQLREQLLPQFTQPGRPAPVPLPGQDDRYMTEYPEALWPQVREQQYGSPDVVDEAGLNAEIQRRLAEQESARQAARGEDDFGSLMQPYDWTHEFNVDLEADPGYQFRLEQGQRALESSAAARGGLLSGRTLKDLTAYGQGMGSQEYQNAYARAIDEYNREVDAYNRYNTDQTNTFNRLAGLAGIGQTATNTMAQLGSATAGQVGANIIGAGNAQAAGQVGSANAWNNAIGQGMSMYQQNRLMNAINPQPQTVSPFATFGANFSRDPIRALNASQGWTF